VRAVVAGVDDDGVLGDAELIQQVEQLAHVPVVVDHRVVVGRLPAPRLPDAPRLGVGPQVHVGGVHPDKERGAVRLLAPDEVLGRGDRVVVDRLHPLLGQGAGVLDALAADAAEAPVLGGVVLLGRPGVDDAARTKALMEAREVAGGGQFGSSGSSSSFRMLGVR
jgi:hypothetical protein